MADARVSAAAGDPAALCALIDDATGDGFDGAPVAERRALLSAVAAAADALPAERTGDSIAVAEHAIARIRCVLIVARRGAAPAQRRRVGGSPPRRLLSLASPRLSRSPHVASLEAEDFKFRWLLLTAYGGVGDYLRGASVLAGARLDSPAVTDAERARAYVRLSQCVARRGSVRAAARQRGAHSSPRPPARRYYIRADDDVNAERFIRRANDYVHAHADRALLIGFRAARAQIQDAKRKYLEASLAYLDILRSVVAGEVAPDELALFTEKAAICAVLSPAGPQRQRLMGSILRSEYAAAIPPAVLSLLERMASARFLTPADVCAFEARLQPHQTATDSEGATAMRRAMVEHNMLAASLLFKNIRLRALAGLLGVDEAGAERVAATMIKERRLAACIDQVDGFLDFAPEPAAARGGAIKVSAGAGEFDKAAVVGVSYPAAIAAGADLADGAAARLLSWDASIKAICLHTKEASEAVAAATAAAAAAR